MVKRITKPYSTSSLLRSFLIDLSSQPAMETALKLLGSAMMLVGPVIPYLLQLFQMRKENRSDGFSSWTCLVLLVANILRVWFWVGKRFETVLLWQSIIMIFTQVYMLYSWHILRPIQLPGSRVESFWDWKDFKAYRINLSSLISFIYLLHSRISRSKLTRNKKIH